MSLPDKVAPKGGKNEMRLKILIYALLAALSFFAAIYFFMWAANNFMTGLTWEALGLSFIMVLVGIIFVFAAYRNSQRAR